MNYYKTAYYPGIVTGQGVYSSKFAHKKKYFLTENTSQNSFVINEQIAKLGPKSS